MAKKKRRSQAKGYKPPSLSEIFEPLTDGWQNIGDSLVFDPNSEYEFGKQMTVKDAKQFRKDYSDPTDVDGSGRKGTISKEYEIAPSTPKTEISQNEIATETTSNEEDTSGVVEPISDSDEVTKALVEEGMAGIQQAVKDYMSIKGGAHGQKKLDELGGKEYTTNFREAFRNANKTQVYEDTIDSDSPLEKSNVFTIDPATGLPLGVMSRSQRRAWDEALAKKNAPEFNTPEQDKLEYDPSDAYPNKNTQPGENLTKDLNVDEFSKSENVSFEAAKPKDDLYKFFK